MSVCQTFLIENFTVPNSAFKVLKENLFFFLKTRFSYLNINTFFMKKFASIGHPISLSKSPLLHQSGFTEFDIEATFEAIEVKPEDLEQWMKTEARKFDGLSVTAPHKETIRKYIDQEAEAAQKIGAVNTISQKDGILIGTNTDAIGALRAMQTGISLSKKKCLVLGAGGASRAIIFALKTADASITIWNRSREKAEAMAEEFELQDVDEFSLIDPDDFDLIVNATTVGMGEWKSIFPTEMWREKHVAFDAVYDPLETRFLHEASTAGATTVHGDEMLVQQAVEQFRLWHEIDIDPNIMFEAFFE